MKAAVYENERQLQEMRQSYEERLKEQGQVGNTSAVNLKLEQEKLNNPYLSNLNFDEQLSGKIVHIIKVGSNILGKGDDASIPLYGPSIQERHAVIYRKDRGQILLELAEHDCRILLNGDKVTNKVTLNHNDRYVLVRAV